jgi:hypothetical protein
MNIVSATITGSLILNGVNISSITGSESSINALNSFTASAATTGSNQFNGNQTVTGSVDITGSLIVTGSIIGTVTTASYVLNAVSASYAANADLLDNRDSLTFANTGSNSFVGQQNINGAVAITGSLTTTGAITAQTLNVQQVTSSIVYSSGSNVFGNSISNTQSMTGSVGISGSLAVTGAGTVTGILTLNSTISNGTYTYTLPSATGTLALTSALSGYLPLTGGTLTGALSGTSATFSDTSAITLTAADSRIIGGTSGGRLLLANSSTSTYAIIYGATNALPNTIQFYNNNTLSLTLASTGAATFSSSVTATKYTGTSGTSLLAGPSNQLSIGVQYNNTAGAFYFGASNSATPDAIFSNGNGDERMRITYGGNVGIGTATPASFGTQRFLVVGAAAGQVARFTDGTNADLVLDNPSAGITRITAQYGTDGTLVFAKGTGFSETMRITSGGEVLVGTTTTDVNTVGVQLRPAGLGIFVRSGASCLQLNRTTSDGIIASFRTSDIERGSISISGATTSYNTSSDYRLKEDFKEVKGLEKVQAIKVYDYKWKANESRMDGVKAHELAEVLPYAVYGEKDEVDEDGNDKMQGVDYSKLVPIMIAAIQELKAEIDLLKNK